MRFKWLSLVSLDTAGPERAIVHAHVLVSKLLLEVAVGELETLGGIISKAETAVKGRPASEPDSTSLRAG